MPSSPRIRLVVLFGGRSAEHDISRISAFNVLRAVDRERYDVVPVGIDRDGTWRLCSDNSLDTGATALEIAGETVNPFEVIHADPSTAGLTDAPAGASEPAAVSVVFPVLHGPNGEDGTVQGLLEVAGAPYVGSGVLGSAVSMDKSVAKTILAAHRIAQPDWRSIRHSEVGASGYAARLDQIMTELGDTLFVKPANMGSSIGVSKVKGGNELAAAIEHALHYDDVIVIEEAVTAREIETAVLGNDKPILGSIGEILPAAEFYDFGDKYHDGAADIVIPAELKPETVSEIQRTALAAYGALRAEGLARVDLFVNEDHPDEAKRVMVNEINTMPGFTPISMYPQLWEDAGVSYSELIDRLVDLAIDRHRRSSGRRVDVLPNPPAHEGRQAQ